MSAVNTPSPSTGGPPGTAGTESHGAEAAPSAPLPARMMERLRAQLRSSEIWFTALAALLGVAAGAMTVGLQVAAHAIQALLYGLSMSERLSTQTSLSWLQLLALPLGGAALALFTFLVKARKRALVDAVEANALHGGQMSMKDSFIVSGQTLLSNGVGASVGLEAAYAQMGSGFASFAGRFLAVRRSDLRTLVGAGAGAGIAAAFGTPLAGAFYAFEIVIGAYTPSTIAPIAAACVSAVLTARGLGHSPYLIASGGSGPIGKTGWETTQSEFDEIVQVDEMLRPCQPHVQHRTEALPAGNRLGRLAHARVLIIQQSFHFTGN